MLKKVIFYIKTKYPGLYSISEKIFPKHRLKRFLKPRWFYLISKNLSPISKDFGSERGQEIDRYYIEKFLSSNSQVIHGDCLEIKDNMYTKKYGGEKVTKSDILDIDRNNKKANIYGDIRDLKTIKDNSYDCIILTQILQLIDDYESAVRECARILKPQSALLVTVPSIIMIDTIAGVEADFWRFTTASAKYIFSKYFSKDKLEIRSYGNVLAGLSLWIGLSREELSTKELDFCDPNFPCLITIKAIS